MAGLDTAGRIAVGLALAALVSVPADAETIRNWPCEQPLAEHFVPEEVWGGPLPAPLPRDWQGEAAVRATVAVAADPENPPDRGQAEIAAFAERLGADRQQALLGVFAGLLEEFDTLRAIAVEGVRDFVVRAKILNESVEDHDAVLAALPAHGARGGGVPVPPLRLSRSEAASPDGGAPRRMVNVGARTAQRRP
jgi:hypothetical protein